MEQSYMSLTSGQKHTCGLGTDNNTYCWGSNEEGQMSADSSTSSVRQVQRYLIYLAQQK